MPDFLAADVDTSIKNMIGQEPKNIIALMQLRQFENLFKLKQSNTKIDKEKNSYLSKASQQFMSK